MSRPFQGLRVLIVEAQFIVAMSLQDIMTELGAEIVGSVPKVGEAMELARTAEIDVAILDLWQEGGQCFPIAEVLAERGLPFVLMGGVARSDEPARFRTIPRVLKPFTSAELCAALILALKRSHTPHGCSGVPLTRE